MIIGLSAGRDSPTELRERVALDEAGVRAVLNRPRPGVGELVVLSTCHRTELYATADGLEADAVHAVVGLLPDLQATDQHDLRLMQGSEAIEHLFRVACGLDSLVIGEPQVLAQVRQAYNLSQEEGACGPVLANVFSRAIRLGRRARTETPIGSLGMSIGSLTANHLSLRLEGLKGKTGAVVGAGQAAGDAARSLIDAGATLSVLSRSIESAGKLAAELGTDSYSLDEMASVFGSSDFAVVAVSGGVLVGPAHVPTRSSHRPFQLVDLSVPRSIDIVGRPDVSVTSLEDLPGPQGPDVAAAVIDAEAMVRKEVADLQRWADTRASGPAIRDLRAHVEGLVRDEVARSLGGAQLTPEQAERVAQMAMRIANKLMHGPSMALREADDETSRLIRRMFGLDV